MKRAIGWTLAILFIPGAAFVAAYKAVRYLHRAWNDEGDPKLARIARTYAAREDFIAESVAAGCGTEYKSAVGR